jgi:predicted flap endonuclease-1-like 5' DNA nuclease
MMTLIAANGLPLFLALAIGMITGWWVWANRVRDAAVPTFSVETDLPFVDAPDGTPVVPPGAALAATGAASLAIKPVRPKDKLTPKPARKPKPAKKLNAIGIPEAIGAPDRLLQLKGVGPKLNLVLNGLGITRFDQIAAWTKADVARVDSHLANRKGAIEREKWIEQAKLLKAGKRAEFEARFGLLDSENA